jgi:hypothetical protein
MTNDLFLETHCMIRTFRWAVGILVLAAAPAWSPAAGYTIKTIKAEPPKEIKEPIRKLLGDQSVQLLDSKGTALCQLWFRKEVPAEATAEQVKTGLTYREVKETTVLGAVKYLKGATDYRQQKIKAGVYTLRLGFQPMDGDHMGVSPTQEFCLLVSADKDEKADTMEAKALQELSTKSIGTTHPAVLMLFPYEKPKSEPTLAKKENEHWVLNVKGEAKAAGKKTELGIGLTLIGHAD